VALTRYYTFYKGLSLTFLLLNIITTKRRDI